MENKSILFQRGDVFLVIHLDADDARGGVTSGSHFLDGTGEKDENERGRLEKLGFLSQSEVCSVSSEFKLNG